MKPAVPPAYPARLARERAGYTLERAARAAGVQPRYLAACERSGRFSYGRARRLAGLYGCGIDLFLPTVTSGRPGPRGPREGGASRPRRGVGDAERAHGGVPRAR